SNGLPEALIRRMLGCFVRLSGSVRNWLSSTPRVSREGSITSSGITEMLLPVRIRYFKLDRVHTDSGSFSTSQKLKLIFSSSVSSEKERGNLLIAALLICKPFNFDREPRFSVKSSKGNLRSSQ